MAVAPKAAAVGNPRGKVPPMVEATAMEFATCHGPAMKSATAKSCCATKTASVETTANTTSVETAPTKTAAVKAAATKTAAAVEAPAATAKAAPTASATAGQGNSRCKHANRGSCNQGDDCFTQHEGTP